MSKKWIIIAVVLVVVIVLSIPSAALISLNNSTYDCSYEYIKMDDPMMEIAKKHVYYNAGDKTVELEISQDMINSLIKDNMAKLPLSLPKNFSIKELMFNTKDQRIYINAKYGSINVPVSIKLGVKLSDAGIELAGSDLMLGKSNAPGFVKNQISESDMKFAFKYQDFGVPQVFTIKDIKFGSGVVIAIIQLDTDKICEMALEYRKNLLGEVNKFKDSQGGIIHTFISKVLGTEVVSETKVKEYVLQALGNEELVNSAIHFAMAKDLDKYTRSFETAQKKVMEWTAPLQAIKYYGSIDETIKRVLYDQKLRDLVGWFLPPESINEYTRTVEDYYGMYQDYYAMYMDTLASIDRAVAGIKTKDINEYAKFIMDYAAQAEDGRDLLLDGLSMVDAESIDEMVYQLEQQDGPVKDYIDRSDPDAYSAVREVALQLDDMKPDAEAYLRDADMSIVKDFSDVVDGRRKFAVSVISKLKSKQYESALTSLASDGVYDRQTRRFVDKVKKEIDLSMVEGVQ